MATDTERTTTPPTRPLLEPQPQSIMKQKESGQKDASSPCKSNCQNGKSKSGWQHKKNQDKKKHHLLANHLCQNGKDESKLS
jgi:hypothetical protein